MARPDPRALRTQFATRSIPFVTDAHSFQPLPDVIEPGLSVIFCGINPGNRAASTGRHFAGRGNRFWRVVHLAGFTPEELRSEADRTFLQYACGLTTAVTRPTARADELSREEIKAAASAFERKIERYEPRYIAFLGKMAISGMSGKRDIEWGLQPKTFGGARAWVLPNPSGLNRAFSLDALVIAYRELRVAIASAGSAREYDELSTN
jgi:double-stranded uracil-DNA glycosylase